MGLINTELNTMLDTLVTECFSINRMLDRGMSILAIKFKMVNTSKILHQKIAHAYPSTLFADGISDYQGSRNNLTVYGETPIGNEDYNTPLEFIKAYYDRNINLQEMVYDAVDKAVEIGDYTTKVFLDSLLVNIAKFTEQAITLVDLFSDYGSEPFNLQMLDSNIEKYVTV